jgi:hypothetical protein
MSKLGVFRYEIVSIALIPLATGLVLAGFEGLRFIQRHRRQAMLQGRGGVGLNTSLVSGQTAAGPSRLAD